MTFTVIKSIKAIDDFDRLSPEQQCAVEADYDIIQSNGIEFVKRRFLQDGIFEIKTGNIRSLFKFEENQIIIIGLIYIKKTQQTPKQILRLAKRRLAEE